MRKPLHTVSDVEPHPRPMSTSPDRITKSEADAVGQNDEQPSSASVASFGG